MVDFGALVPPLGRRRSGACCLTKPHMKAFCAEKVPIFQKVLKAFWRDSIETFSEHLFLQLQLLF